MPRPLVIFHANCADGFAAAWIAQNTLARLMKFPKFMALNYQDPIPDFTDKEVYILDFSFDDTDTFLQMCEKAEKVVMLDHHATAKEALEQRTHPQTLDCRFNLERSGCGMAWEYFRAIADEEHYDIQRPMPGLLLRIQDRDLWQFEMEGSRAIHALLESHGIFQPVDEHVKLMENFAFFSKLVHQFTIGEYKMISEGEAILRAREQLIRSIIARNSKLVEFVDYAPSNPDDERSEWKPLATYKVPVCEIPYEFASEAGHILSEGHPFSITYESQWATGKRKFSVRSQAGTGIIVSDLAARQGGGGHVHAAGWYADINEELPFNID